jgi:hypothetical protein
MPLAEDDSPEPTAPSVTTWAAGESGRAGSTLCLLAGRIRPVGSRPTDRYGGREPALGDIDLTEVMTSRLHSLPICSTSAIPPGSPSPRRTGCTLGAFPRAAGHGGSLP